MLIWIFVTKYQMYDLNQFKSDKQFKNEFLWSYKPSELIGKMTQPFV